MIGLDCETTGLDLRHGAKPYLVTICDEDDNQQWWEWNVDPITREPVVIYEDLIEIQQVIDDADCLVLQNPKFDVAALQEVFLGRLRWDWSKVYDTLLAGHLLASNQPHELATMVLIYLGVNILPYENALKKAVNECRRMCQGKNAKYPNWRIAKKGLPGMPSVKGQAWKQDGWLPRTVSMEEEFSTDHPWWTVCSEYANMDSASTLALFKRQREVLKERGLWKIYMERLKILHVVCAMGEHGVTLNAGRLEELVKDYSVEAKRLGYVCTNIAKGCGYELNLPKGSNNKSLKEFVFGKTGVGPLGIGAFKRSKKTGEPSLDKDTFDHLEATLPRHGKALLFIRSLQQKRKRDTALSFMESYKRFWLPLNGHGLSGRRELEPRKAEASGSNPVMSTWYVLYPSANPTGADTLRWSYANPNTQQVSKLEDFNLRYCFGPAPGREWWSLDAKNIELRIPAYEAGETEMIDLFERPDDAPYFGSYHLLVFDTLHPQKFASHGTEAKKVYESTWYAWTKNGNFAVQYGAVEQSGTADRAYHVPGAQRRIQQRFSRIARFNQQQIAYAKEHGYVETMPDKTVDPDRGYPLRCSRSNWGSISPTIPLNYHVQGTACWWMMKGMIRVQAYLDELNVRKGSKGYYMICQVHDELLFDFPKAGSFWEKKPEEYNLPRIRKIQKLMEQGGDDIGVPTPVSIEYHPSTWSEGVTI